MRVSNLAFTVLIALILAFALGMACDDDDDDAIDDDSADDDVADDSGDDDDTNPDPPPSDNPTGLPIDFYYSGGELFVLFNDFQQAELASGVGVFQELENGLWEKRAYLSENQIPGGLEFPHTLDVTELGNYLISDSDQARAIEVTANGEIAWEFQTNNFTNEALETGSGNRLLTVGNQLWLVDIGGDVIWEVSPVADGLLHHGQLLANGNLLVTTTELVTEAGQVLEMTTAGELVWQFQSPELIWPRNAWRLDNGNTVIAHKLGIWEVNPSGEIVWEIFSDAAVYNIQLIDNGWIIAVVGPDIVWMDETGQIQKTFSWQDEPQGPLSQEVRDLLSSHPYLR